MASIKEIIERRDWERVPNYLDQVKDADPLFHSLWKIAPLSTIKLLLEAYPQAALEKCGWTPLHAAAYWDHPLETIKLLLEAYPQALRQKDSNGATPLHWAIHHDHPLSTIK